MEFSIGIFRIFTFTPTSTRARIAESESGRSFRGMIPLLIFPCRSPGYGLTLLALSNTAALHSAETISVPAPSSTTPASFETTASATSTQRFQTPEELATHAARLLLESVARGGCVDESHQWLVLLMMVLGPEDVGRCRMGALTPFS